MSKDKEVKAWFVIGATLLGLLGLSGYKGQQQQKQPPPPPPPAQPGGMRVTVTNPSGAALPGSTVVVTNPVTGVVAAQGQTNTNGVFDTGLTIPAGAYNVQATNPSYKAIFQLVNVIAGVDSTVGLILASGTPPPVQAFQFVSLQVSSTGGTATWALNPQWPTFIPVSAWITLQNAAGQTIGIGNSLQQAVPPGQQASFHVDFSTPVPAGTYQAQTFVVDQNNNALSYSIPATVTIGGGSTGSQAPGGGGSQAPGGGGQGPILYTTGTNLAALQAQYPPPQFTIVDSGNQVTSDYPGGPVGPPRTLWAVWQNY